MEDFRRGIKPAAVLGGFSAALLCLLGYLLLLQRADIPKAAIPPDTGEALVRVGDTDIRIPADKEFALAFERPGRPLRLTLRGPSGAERTVAPTAAPFYANAAYPLAFLLVGLASIGLGTATGFLKPRDPKARIFFWLALSFGITVAVQGDSYGLRPSQWPTFIPSLFFILGYAFVPALFLHLSLAFGRPSPRIRRGLLYLPAGLAAAVLGGTFLLAFAASSIEAFRLNVNAYRIFRIYVVAYCLAAIFHLGRTYRRAGGDSSRARIKWVFFGLSIGLAPYILLYMIPRAFDASPLLSEEITAFFFVLIPAAFAISIVRHQLLDIEIVISRSLVYSLLTVFTVGLYLLIVEIFHRLLARAVSLRSGFTTAAAVFLAAAAFNPARRRLQDLVDRTFFRKRFDIRRAVLEFSERAYRYVRREDLLDGFERAVQAALPVELLRPPVPMSGRNGEASPDGAVPASLAEGGGAAVLARSASVRETEGVDFSAEKTLERLGIELALPVRSSSGGPGEWLMVGKKKSGTRFEEEDIELLQTLTNELAVNLERLRLQEEVVYERASREKSDELNRLKTEFVASVSHELRTPMSSIRGVAELLRSGKIRGREQRERCLDLMLTESGRLSRFLHNVLDYGRAEGGTMAFHLAKGDLRDAVREAVEAFRTGAGSAEARLDVVLPDAAVEANIDRDAVIRALTNLIDNALKYSAAGAPVAVELRRSGGRAEILVRDAGIGIAPEDVDRIFREFFRAESAVRMAPRGAGLGLKIVARIMEGHGGAVRVESEAGQGSVFRLVFPEVCP